MHEIFKELTISEYEDNIFNGDYTNVYLLYCVAIAKNKLLSVADGSIFALYDAKLKPHTNYLLKLRISTLGNANMYILNKDDYILVECVDELKQVKLNKVSQTKMFTIDGLKCYVIDCSDLDSDTSNVTNIIIPVELEILSNNGIFLYSYEYDEYLSRL